jgi:arsenate reductase
MRILILCTGNSCRSQMAAGFLRKLRPHWEVSSAGTSPAGQVHPLAVMVMGEESVDLTGALPQPVDAMVQQPFDYIITVCDQARESCPVFTGTVGRRMHIGFPDPARATGTEEEVLAVFRNVRDAIRQRIEIFAAEAATGSIEG